MSSRGHDRLRHAREAGELVDHAADIVDLAHDRVGALVEDVAVFDDHFAVFAFDAFGRKLNRRKRVFDFVRDAAGDVGPGRGTLGRDKFGNIVERDDVAMFMSGRLLAGDADGEDRSRPCRAMVTWSCGRAPLCAARKMLASSGTISTRACPMLRPRVCPISFSAERLRMLMRPHRRCR